MSDTRKTNIVAKTLSNMAKTSMKVAANSRCFFVYHQPKQPMELKKFRMF